MSSSETILERQFREGDLGARLTLLKSLVEKNQEENIRLVIEAMGDTAWQVRKEALATLATFDDPSGLVRRLIERISDNSSVGRRNAAVELFISWGKISIPSILERFMYVNEDTQKVLIDVLGGIGDPSVIPFLLENILKEGLLKEASSGFADNLRSAALEALGKLRPSDEAVESILCFLSNKENTLLVFSAIKALEKIRSPLAVPHLLVLSKEKVFQRAALSALGSIGDIRALDCFMAGFHAVSENMRSIAVKAIVQCESQLTASDQKKLRQAIRGIYQEEDYTFLTALLLHHSDAFLKRCAIRILGWVTEVRSLLTLMAFLHEEEEEVIQSFIAMGLPVLPELVKLPERGIWEQEKSRYAVAYVLGEIPSAQGIPLLLDLLNDDVATVRETAVRALGKTGCLEVIQPLLSMLKDPYPDVQEAARNALIALEAHLPKEILVHILSESSARLRANAALLLGELRYFPAIASLAFLIKDSEETVRRAAICALGLFLPCDDVRRILLQALGDEDYKVRMAVLQALRRDRVDILLNDLRPLIYDENIWVRAELARTLATVAGEESFKLLSQLSEDTTGMVRIAALTALGQRSERRIPDLIMKHLNSSDRDVQKAAILALGAFGDEAAITAIIPFLSDPYWELRAAAASAVGDLKVSVSQLKEMSESDEDPFVRDAASIALARCIVT